MQIWIHTAAASSLSYKDQWIEIITGFFLERSSQKISDRTLFERKRGMRARKVIRTALIKDTITIFSGSVEVDESNLGGQGKTNK